MKSRFEEVEELIGKNEDELKPYYHLIWRQTSEATLKSFKKLLSERISLEIEKANISKTR